MDGVSGESWSIYMLFFFFVNGFMYYLFYYFPRRCDLTRCLSPFIMCSVIHVVVLAAYHYPKKSLRCFTNMGLRNFILY